MLSKEQQISILARLSMADNEVADEEFQLILLIGKMLGVDTDRVFQLIKDPEPAPPTAELKRLRPDQKFEYLFNVIGVMKVDGKVHVNEIKFCEKLAMNLGYKPGVIGELSRYIYKDPNINSDQEFLREIADKHLINKEF